jgi:hypothetical protein
MAPSLKGSVSVSIHSIDAGRELGHGVASVKPSAVLVFASVEHDQAALLRGLREIIGEATPIIGCSTQGVTGRGTTIEGGYFAAAVGFGGDFRAAVACVHEAQVQPRASGQRLGASLRQQLPAAKLALLFFDPLAGLDVTEFLSGLAEEVHCPVVGGAASQPWGPMVMTYQYFGSDVFSHGAVALALDGPFEFEVAASHGTEPVGLEHVITRAEGTQILELDSRPAAAVWKESLAVGNTSVSQMATLAIGLPNEAASVPELGEYRVLSPTVFNPDSGGFHVLTSVPAGTRAVLHYRTTSSVLEGTRQMARNLAARIGTRKILGVLGFECGARTEPFLGREATVSENAALQEQLAPSAEWLGMMAWGEVLPLQSGPTVVNYTYPLVCLLAP